MLELTTNKKCMLYRSRMHNIICLWVRREILIRCIWSSRMGHTDQYNDIHIPVIFTCMKTICYDFEDSFGIPHSMMSVRELLLTRATWRIPIPPAQGEQPSRGTPAVWGKRGPCRGPGHTRQHLCSALDHCSLETHVTLFCWVSSNHSQRLSDPKGKGTTNLLLYLKTDDCTFASRCLAGSRLSNYLPRHSEQFPRAQIQSLKSPVLRFANKKMGIYLRWNLILISQIQLYFPGKTALATMSV